MVRTPITLDDGGSQLVIKGEDIPFGAYQAIYHKLTKTVEKRVKAYAEAFDLDMPDIINLHQRLMQATKQYSLQSARCQVTHSFRDDTSREHTSFDRFKLSDCSVRSCTKRLVYELDFLVVLPPEIEQASEIAQRYKISLVADQNIIDDDDIDAPYFIRGFILGGNLTLTIEFADYAVSQALQSIVDGWHDTLPRRSVGRIGKTLARYERTLRDYTPPIVEFMTLIAAARAISGIGSLRSAFILVLASLATSQFLGSLSSNLLDSFFRIVGFLKPQSHILITKGDQERKTQQTRKQNSKRATAAFILVGVIMTIVLGLFNNYVYAEVIAPLLTHKQL